MSLGDLPYVKMLMEPQEPSREVIGYLNVPVEIQRREGNLGSPLITTTPKCLHSKGQRSKNKFSGRCNWCQKLGHVSKDCRGKARGDPKRETISDNQNTENANVAQMTGQEPPAADFAFTCKDANLGSEPDQWIFDSGPPEYYYTGDREKLCNKYRSYNGRVTTAGKKKLIITAIGTNIKLGLLKFVKQMGRNLLSIGQMSKNPET